MAFRKKAAAILAHQPDILVVPECEHPDKLIFPPDLPQPADTLWFGKNPHKGLAIFSYSQYRFTLHQHHNPGLRMIIPIAVSGGAFQFNLFAIWANHPEDPDGPYVEQVWKALHQYKDLLSNKKTILAGDFNSNTIWDRKSRMGNHSDVVKFLEEKSIFSAYHHHHRQTQGREEHPTHFLYRHQDKPYHLDYCFLSADLIKKLHTVEVGEYETWAKHSDHVPVMVTIGKTSLKKTNNIP